MSRELRASIIFNWLKCWQIAYKGQPFSEIRATALAPIWSNGTVFCQPKLPLMELKNGKMVGKGIEKAGEMVEVDQNTFLLGQYLH